MSFGGFGGAEETLAYMIKAFDMATPVFRAFGAEVEGVTTKVQASLDRMNRAMVAQSQGVTEAALREDAAIKKMGDAQVAAADKAKLSSDRQVMAARASAAAVNEQALAAQRSSERQIAAATASEATFGRSSSALSRYGRDALLFAAGVGGASLDMAAKFQANTLRMETQAGATAAGLDKIRQGLLKMAGQVGFTPDQLANGMYHVVSSMNAVLPATSRVSQELTIMKIAAEGAQIGHSNLEDTTYALGSAMNALHQHAGQAQHTMAELNAIVGAGDMTMQDLVDAFKSGLVPAAQTFGISLQSVGAALAVMGDMGMRGALAGTRLRMAISLLAAPTKQASGILETLGMSSKQALASTSAMSDLLKKAGINVSTLSNDLRKPDGLQVALSDLNNHLKSNGLSADAAGAAIDRAFGGGRMGATIKLLAENTDRLGIKFNQITGLSHNFGQDWQKTTETFRVQLDKALASVEALGIGLGNKLMPYATMALHDLQDMANWLIKNKTALDILGGAIITFASVAVGSYLIAKLRTAIELFQTFGRGASEFGSWMFGMGGQNPMLRSATDKRVNKATLGELASAMGGGSVAGGMPNTSTIAGGIWGINATQIRVGTLMNPLAVAVVRGAPGMGQAEPLGGGGPVAAGAMSAEEKAVLAQTQALAAETQSAAAGVAAAAKESMIASGPFKDPTTGKFISASQFGANQQMKLGTSSAIAEEQRLFASGGGTLPMSFLPGSLAPSEMKALRNQQLSLFGSAGNTGGLANAGQMLTAEEQLALAAGGPGALSRMRSGGGSLLRSAGGFASNLGGGLLRGGLLTGMGMFGAQTVGQMVGGHTGSTISRLGTAASIGGGIGLAAGSILPIAAPITAAIGAGAGIMVEELKHFFSSPDFGHAAANSLSKGFGGPHRSELQKTIADSLNQMAALTHPINPNANPRFIAASRGGQVEGPQHLLALTPDQLTGEALAKYKAAATAAGLAIAGQLEKGWNQYKFQSEPIMFQQLRAEMAKMPPMVRANASDAAIAFAAQLSKDGKLPKHAADEMLAQIETAFPGLTKYMGETAAQAIAVFHANFNMKQTEADLKTTLDNMRGDFPQLVQAMDQTKGSFEDKSKAVITALQGIITHGTKPMKEQAKADLAELQKSTGADFKSMAQQVSASQGLMTQSIAGGFERATAAAGSNLNQFVGQVQAAMKGTVLLSNQGMQDIGMALNATLKAFGAAPLSLPSAIQWANYAAGNASAASYGSGTGGIGHRFAAGGIATRPTYMVGEEAPTHPEYILATNPAYHSRNVSLWQRAGHDLGIPGFATGGYVFPFPSGEKFGWDRIDQGQDLRGPPGGPVLAVGPGVVGVGHDAFSGFGPSYPVETMASGPWAGRSIYYGHVRDTLTGAVRAGQIIGYTQARANQWTAAPAGWLELGFTSALGHGIQGQGAEVAPLLHALASGHMVAGAGGASLLPNLRVGGGGAVGGALQAALNLAVGAANQVLSSVGTGASTGAGIHSGSWFNVASQLAKRHGWPSSEVQAWYGVEQLEDSSLSLTARNPASGAYGLAQGITGPSWYYGYGGNPNTEVGQLTAMANYMAGRYGTPSAALAHEHAFHWYAQGGRRPAFAGAFGTGGSFTAHGPTMGLFGERGAEDVFAVPHYQTGGIHGASDSTTSTQSSTGAHSYATTTTSIVGTTEVTTTDRTTVDAKGGKHTTVTVTTRQLKQKATHYTTEFNPLTDRIESHTSEQWHLVHAEYAKQRHDAAQEKKSHDAWLAETVKDMLTIGGGAAGVVDLTRKQAGKEHLPMGANFALTPKNLGGLSDQGFSSVLTGLKHYLSIDDLSSTMKLMTKELQTLGKHVSPTSRGAQVENVLIASALKGTAGAFANQQKQFQHQDTVASLIEQLQPGTHLGLTKLQRKAIGLNRGQISSLMGDSSGPAAFARQVDELSNQVIPAYQKDAKQLTAEYHAALKTHNKKLAAAIKTQLDTVTQAELQAIADKQKAQVALVDSIYQKAQTQDAKLQSGSDIVSAVRGLPAGTSLASIGLSNQALGALGFSSAQIGQLGGFAGGGNPMAAAQMSNQFLASQRSTDAGAMADLLNQLPTLKGDALDQANQHIQDLAKAMAGLTNEINQNLMGAIHQVEQSFQDSADLAAGGASAIQAIGDLSSGTNLSSLGITPAVLAALGISPGQALGAEGGGPNIAGGQGSASYVSALNSFYQQEITGLSGELQYDISQLPSLSGSDQTSMLAHIAQLIGSLAGLQKSIDQNTHAVNANTASTTSTGQLTGTVAYTYNNEDFTASLSSEAPVNLSVGS